MARRGASKRDVERAREYLEGRGQDCDGMTDEEILVAAGMRPAPRQDQRTADRIDGYDRDDLGESPDY